MAAEGCLLNLVGRPNAGFRTDGGQAFDGWVRPSPVDRSECHRPGFCVLALFSKDERLAALRYHDARVIQKRHFETNGLEASAIGWAPVCGEIADDAPSQQFS